MNGLLPCLSLLLALLLNVDVLLGLIERRLELAEPVARVKWNRGSPIEDPARESQLLDSVAARSGEFDVDPELARRFFRAQIEASKVVQRDLFERWQGQGPWPDAPSLEDLRRRLDALTPALLAELHEDLTGLRARALERWGPRLTPAQEASLSWALAAIPR